jgi:hypothetical protein
MQQYFESDLHADGRGELQHCVTVRDGHGDAGHVRRYLGHANCDHYGTALSGAQLNATAKFAGTFAYSPTLGTVLKQDTNTLNVTFTP